MHVITVMCFSTDWYLFSDILVNTSCCRGTSVLLRIVVLRPVPSRTLTLTAMSTQTNAMTVSTAVSSSRQLRKVPAICQPTMTVVYQSVINVAFEHLDVWSNYMYVYDLKLSDLSDFWEPYYKHKVHFLNVAIPQRRWLMACNNRNVYKTSQLGSQGMTGT